MARKSAKSKGYRKAAGKKPYLTKRDIIMLCVLIVVVAIGAALLFSYDDGALKVKDGKLVDAGENWLVVNGSASGGKRYYKLGEAGELDGYARTTEPMAADENLTVIRYTPEDEASPVTGISLSASPSDAARVAEYYRSVTATATEPSAVQTGDADGVPFSYFTYQMAYHVAEEAADAEAADAEAPAEEAPAEAEEAAEEAEAEPNKFEQAIHAYIDAPHSSAIGLSVTYEVPSEADFLTDEQLVDMARQVISTIAVEEK